MNFCTYRMSADESAAWFSRAEGWLAAQNEVRARARTRAEFRHMPCEIVDNYGHHLEFAY